MLVWKAMLSITLMMSAIFFELSLMPFMVSTTWLTTVPPRVATVEALSDRSLAWRALSALSRTVAPSCSIEAAVCSSALACSSVRLDKSKLPCAIWADAVATPSAFERTVVTTSARFACMADSARSRSDTSSRPVMVMGWLKSPWATAFEAATASFNERVMPRTRKKPNRLAQTSPRLMEAMATMRMFEYSATDCS